LAVVEPKNATEPFTALDHPADVAGVVLGLDQTVVQSLVISLRVIMGCVITDGPSQRPSPKKIILLRHSDFVERTNLSAYALRFGDR
jgi:hypothetical protein